MSPDHEFDKVVSDFYAYGAGAYFRHSDGTVKHIPLPELPDPIHERQCAAVLPIVVAAIVALLMVAALMWLPGIP